MATNKRLIKSNDEGGGGAASFNTVLYTGDGTSSQPITGVGFEPDFVWIKNRSSSDQNHVLFDSVRGVQKELRSDSTAAESDYSATIYSLKSFDDNGFTVGDITGGNYNVNGAVGGLYSGDAEFVAWCWKAGGAAVTNTDGTITSQVSANTEAGFSIVSFTSSPTANQVYSLGHGLGNTPKVIITKERDGTLDWITYHESLGFGSFVVLNSTNASNSGAPQVWGTTPPNSSVFEMKSSITINPSKQAIAYCFAEVAGFSKFGSYSGSNSPITIYTTDDGTAGGSNPFEPAFIMTKRTNSSGGSWIIQDNKRRTTDGDALFPNLSAVESFGWNTSFNSNGFTISSNEAWISESGGEYIYMAFANQF